MAKYNCSKCNIDFSTKGNLNRHARIYHQAEFNNKGHGSLKCPQCTDLLGTYLSLMQHLNRVHSYQLACKHVSFKSEADFKEWKTNLEMESSAEFVQNSGARRCGVRHTTHFRCHRSGKFRSRSQNKRHLKNIGSNKINEVCTAFIRKVVTQTGVMGEVRIEVDYCDTHSGHSMEPERLHLPLNVKRCLAAKMAAGVSMEQILLDANNNQTKCRRDGLVTRKDLHNIAASFNVNDEDKNRDLDSDKVTAFVHSLTETDSPVLLFKKKGQLCPNYPNLSADDFVLSIMNDIQQYLLVEHSVNGILIDSVPDSETQLQGIYLSTVMVRDENFKFYPVALLFANSKSSEILVAFFNEIRSRLTNGEDLKPQIFMSDDDPAYYMAWKSCFGEVQHNLICCWYVSRVLEQNLMSIVDDETRVEVRRDFYQMQQELDVATFDQLLENNCQKWINFEGSAEFGKYFKTNFANRKQQWAFCYQISAHVNTSTVISGWHSELEECGVLNGMVTRRLDRCLHAIMTSFNKKIDKESWSCSRFRFSPRLLSTRQRHRNSFGLNFADVYEVTPKSKWLVPSSSNDVNSDLGYYQVFITQTDDCSDCQLTCSECNICVHQFQCQCVDRVVRFQICEHVHLISRYLRNDCSTGSIVIREMTIDHSPLQRVLDVLTTETQLPPPSDDDDPFQAEMMRLMMDIKWMVNESVKCQSISELQNLRSGIESALVSLETHRTSQLNNSYSVLITSTKEETPINKRPLQRILPKEMESKSNEMDNKDKETPLFLIIGVQ